MAMRPSREFRSAADIDLDSTASLLLRVRQGDSTARDQIVRRYLPPLQRWASGRLPARVRGLTDTDDLVQVTLLRALNKMEGFEPRHEGAFAAYLRRILKNQIRDEIRRARRRPAVGALPEELSDDSPSPLEEAIGKERLQAYEDALARLRPQQKEALILRFELGFTHAEVARAMGSPSSNAARMAVTRALVQLIEVMDE